MTVENTFHCKIWILRIQRPRELNDLLQCPYFVIQFTLSRAWILSRCTVLTNSVLLDRYSRIVYIYMKYMITLQTVNFQGCLFLMHYCNAVDYDNTPQSHPLSLVDVI